MEDLSRAMGGMDLQQQGQPTQTNYAHGGPRFNSSARQASPNLQQQQYMDGSQQQQGRNLKLYTDVNQNVNHGPVSAGAYIPPIGHGQGGQRPVSSFRRCTEFVLTPLSRNARSVDDRPTPTSRRHSTTPMAAINLTITCPLHRQSLLNTSIKLAASSTQGGLILVLLLLNRVTVVSVVSVRLRSQLGSNPVTLQRISVRRLMCLL